MRKCVVMWMCAKHKMYNSLIKYIYHCCYLTYFCITYKAMQTVFIFFLIISDVSFIVPSMWKDVSKIFISNSCLVLKVCILSFTRVL